MSYLATYAAVTAKKALSAASDAQSSLGSKISALPTHTVSAVNPEGSVTAPVGSTHFNSATNTLWNKETGSGNTGWV